MDNFFDWLNRNDKSLLTEYAVATRYSVEVNFRSSSTEVLEQFVRICLGYVSAALKKMNYHVKKFLDESDKELYILIAERTWDDGEWVVKIKWDKERKLFKISRGFFNKLAETITVKEENYTNAVSAKELTKDTKKILDGLKSKPNGVKMKLKGVKLKTGPKSNKFKI